ncbi:MAG: efflux RND transporter periplasmic adaptor subunit [Planctomycetaceae bacterium]
MATKTSRITHLLTLAITRGLPLVLGLAVLVGIIAWMSGAFVDKVAPGEQEVAVRRRAPDQPVAAVGEVLKEYVEEALGTLRAADRTVISPKVLARIRDISVQADEEVEAGQVLVELEEGELRARLNQATEAVQAATASATEAQSAFDRIKTLYEKDATSKAVYDEAFARFKVAEADLRRSEQSVAEATAMLSYTVIAAPKAGRVVDRLAEPGDMATPGQPLLTMYDPNTLRLEVPVMEHLALKLKIGDKVTVGIDALNRELAGTVAQRVPQAEASSRSFLVKVDVPQSGELFEGMFGRLLIPAGERRHLCLPTTAIQSIGQLDFVDVVRSDDTLERRFIKTGREGLPGKIEVLSGLEAGENVIVHSGSSDHTHDSNGGAHDE